jgi:hypothetical protein
VNLLVLVGDLGKGVGDAGWSAFQHGVLHSEFMLMRDFPGELGTVVIDGGDGDLNLLEGEDNSDMRMHSEEVGLGGLDLA